MTPVRSELLNLLSALSAEAEDLRFGQLIANLATLGRGATAEAIWDAEDEELVSAARRLLTHYQRRNADVA